MKHGTRWGIAALLLLGASLPAAGRSNFCGEAIQRIALPGQWSGSEKDGVAHYRRETRLSIEGLTTVTYAIDARFHDATQRTDFIRRVVDGRRELERAQGGTVVLSAITKQHEGAILRRSYSGENLHTGRRFADLTVSTACYLQHVYYEALRLSAPEFARRSLRILGSLEVQSQSQTVITVIPVIAALRTPGPVRGPLMLVGGGLLR